MTALPDFDTPSQNDPVQANRGTRGPGATARAGRPLPIAATVLALPLIGWLAAAGEPAAIVRGVEGVVFGFGPVVDAVASNLVAAVGHLGVQPWLVLASLAALVIDRGGH